MHSRPLVSVIMSFLNMEKFIQESIRSVFAQTYDNWEALLVNDGSTDGSTEIALHYAKQYPDKVRYLQHAGRQNRGISASHNLGISHAKGRYIAFLDADDVWLPHKLEQQVAIMDSHPDAAMMYGNTQYWFSWTGRPDDLRRDFVPRLGIQPDSLVQPPSLLVRFLREEAAVPCPCSILVRREVFEKIGGFENSFRFIYTDQAFYAKLCLEAPVFVASGCWDRYRQHPDSTCHTVRNTGQAYAARLTYLTWLEDYFSEKGVRNAEVWQALRKALWPYRHPFLYRLSRRARGLKWQVVDLVKDFTRGILPPPVYAWLKARWRGQEYVPPMGWVRFGSLRRVTPISRDWGRDRGLAIDRYYIERFLSAHASDIRGRVLEIGDDTYTRKFGGNSITISDVLHLTEGNPKATFVGDLTTADHIPSDIFDCVILTQTLQLIYDVRAALKTLYRILKPGGVLLATFPGISQIADKEWGGHWCWNFTTLSARRLFEEVFPSTNVGVESHGNVLAAVVFLHGLATQELRQEELDLYDPGYPVIITARAVKTKGRV